MNTVEVRLRASPGIIHGLGPGDFRATIDLAGRRRASASSTSPPTRSASPSGLRVVKITPSILTLNFERTLQKDVPVRPRLIGRPAPGFEVAEVTSEPAQVRIAGPRSRVQEIESAFTEPVSVEGAETTVTELVNIGLEDPLLRLEGGSRVKVTAAVREAREMRSFEGLPVVARGGPARLAPSRVTVSVAGPASQVRGLAPGDLQPYVAIPRDGAVPPRLPVAVELASGPGRRERAGDAAGRGFGPRAPQGEPALTASRGSLFGTDGIRGVANDHPMTPELALALGRAVTFVAGRGKRHAPRVLIGKDTRLSGYMLETAIASGDASMGGRVLLCGPVPTPAVAHLTVSMRADAGIVISASHNPYADNGIKIFGGDGFKLPDEAEAEIEALIREPPRLGERRRAPPSAAPRSSRTRAGATWPSSRPPFPATSPSTACGWWWTRPTAPPTSWRPSSSRSSGPGSTPSACGRTGRTSTASRGRCTPTTPAPRCGGAAPTSASPSTATPTA